MSRPKGITPVATAFSDNAFAASVRHGSVKQQKTTEVDCVAYYKQGSPRATLCLSVLNPENVIINPPMTEAMQTYSMFEVLYDFLVNKSARLLASIKKVHEEATCVICLDNPPQCIICKCGHAALCNECLKKITEPKCPLCRGFIEATIKK
jgi:hypothetical protein